MSYVTGSEMSPVSRSTVLRLATLLCLFPFAPPAPAAETEGPDMAKFRREAVFVVSEEVANPAVAPFTATVGSFGNALVGLGFEPPVWRTRLFAALDAPDRVVAAHNDLSGYDAYRESLYDGAEVRVYRIVDGAVRLVRRDRVPEGGARFLDWNGMTPGGKLYPPAPASDGLVRVRVHPDDWNRRGVPYWYAVSAVTADGVESLRSDAVRLDLPAEKPAGKGIAQETVAFQSPKNAPAPASVPAAPTDLAAAYDADTGDVLLSWKPASGDIAGFRVWRSDVSPERQTAEPHLLLADGANGEPVRKGDLVIVAREFRSYSRAKYNSNRVWGASQNNRDGLPEGLADLYPDENPAVSWVLEDHAPDTPVADAGRTCLKVSLHDDSPFALKAYNHASTRQTWYPVLRVGVPHVVEFWARAEGAMKATFRLNGFYNRRVEPIAFEIGPEWRLCRAEFTPGVPYDSDGVGQTELRFEGEGSLWLDNYRVYDSGAAFLDWMPEEYAALRDSGMGMLRTHAFIKTGKKTYSMEGFTNPAGAIQGVSKGNTLPQTLAAFRKANVKPWLQVEWHMAPEEWAGFVEYLAAPYDPAAGDTPEKKPWAAKRAAQGQAAPWTDEFPELFFEIGNETWNWLFSPWVFEAMDDAATGRRYDRGQVYGLFQEYVISCLKASPWWTPEVDAKVKFVLGGWRVQKYGLKAAETSPRSHFVTRAAYNGGWDEGEGPAEGNDPSLFRALIQAGQSAIPEAVEMRAERDRMNAERPETERFAIGTYEAGPGYALSGLNGQAKMSKEQVRAQEETMKSLGAGTATLDTFLGRAAEGYAVQNFFTFRHGRTHWVSHADLARGGQAYPCWTTLALFNREAAGGDMLRVAAESVPTVDIAAYRRRKAAAAVPLAACYALRRGGRLCLFVLSRKIDGYPVAGDDGFTPVSVRLPIAGAARLTLHRLAGDPRAHNLDSEVVKVETLDLDPALARPDFRIDAATGADARGLPPGSTFLYVFDDIEAL